MRETRGAWRGPLAFVLALIYAAAAEDLIDRLAPWQFAAVSAGVIAVLWLLVESDPPAARYIAPPPGPADRDERLTVSEVLWLLAIAVILAALFLAVAPALMG